MTDTGRSPRQNPNLVAQYAEIHRSEVYGNTKPANLRFLRPEVRVLGPSSILDYGCGQSRVLEALEAGARTRLLRYEPAIPEYSVPPADVVDLLINIDVLEHIPEEDLGDTLGHMASLCRNAIIVIDTRPAKRILPNGKNAHCTLHPHEWWKAYLERFFPTVVPIRVARRGRAAFRTWRRSPADELRFRKLRLKEDARFYSGKIMRLVGR